MKRVVPTFLVTGAARSGTTGLVEGLRSHPAVYVTDPKEPHYFALHGETVDFRGPGDANTINRVAVTGLRDYLDLYPRDRDYTALGDGSVSTMYYHPRALPEAVRVNPDIKLVAMLREPVARAYSSWQYMRGRGFEPLEDFSAAVAAEPDRQRQNYHHLWHYTAMSHYAQALAAMVNAVGRERVGVWFYDELEANYEGTVSSVLRFLGVPPSVREAADVPRVNISGTPRSRTLQKLIWTATRNESLRHTVKSLTSYRLRERVRGLVLQRSPVPSHVMAELSPRFDEDRQELTALLPDVVGRPLPKWLGASTSPSRSA